MNNQEKKYIKIYKRSYHTLVQIIQHKIHQDILNNLIPENQFKRPNTKL